MKFRIHEVNKPRLYEKINKENLVKKQTKSLFRILEIEIDPINNLNDKLFIDSCIIKAANMKTNKYNTNNEIRKKDILLKNKYLGIASEILLTRTINIYFKKYNINKKAKNPDFIDHNSHVDILIIDELNETQKSIELRASFPYSNLEDVIWYYFDLIGPYTTANKKYESPKDFYARALINMKDSSFNYNKKHSIYLTGGAPFSLIDSIGVYKTMGTSANYTVIEPLADSFDIVDFIKLI